MFQVWYSLYAFSSWPGGWTDGPGKSSQSCPSDQVPFSLESRAFICYQPHCWECQLVLIRRWLLSKNGQDSPSPISFPSWLQIRCLEGNSSLFCPISFQFTSGGLHRNDFLNSQSQHFPIVLFLPLCFCFSCNTVLQHTNDYLGFPLFFISLCLLLQK